MGRRSNRYGSWGWAEWLVLGLLLWIGPASARTNSAAGQLPTQSFDIDQGLAASSVSRIVNDSKGFLWFCTDGGLSRFDGFEFVNFTRAEGLLGREVTDLVEGRDGRQYWVGTSRGLFVMDTGTAVAKENTFRQRLFGAEGRVNRLMLARDGRVWIGAGSGLFLLDPSREEPALRVLPLDPSQDSAIHVRALVEDPSGNIWVGTHADGLFLLSPDLSHVQHFPYEQREVRFIRDLAIGPDQRVWATSLSGVIRFRQAPVQSTDTAGLVEQRFDARSGLPSWDTSALLVDQSGSITVGTSAGLGELSRDADGTWQARSLWDVDQGWSGGIVSTLARDMAGNLWVGSLSRGAFKRLNSGIVHFPQIENDGGTVVGLITTGRDVEVLSIIDQQRYKVHRLSLTRHTAADVALPNWIRYLGWGPERFARDSTGTWWVGYGGGLLAYHTSSRARGLPDLARLTRPPDRALSASAGLQVDVYSLFADSRDRVWVGAAAVMPGRLPVRCLAARGTAATVFADTQADRPIRYASSFAEARDGKVWIGCSQGVVLRENPSSNSALSVLERVPLSPQLPDTTAAALAFDARGRLWIGSEGVAVVDTPSGSPLQLRRVLPELDNTRVNCIVEDLRGRIYLGTERGVYRFDEASGGLQHFTRADGLPGNDINHCARDAGGDLWFAGPIGVVRFAHDGQVEAPPPQVRVSELSVNGVPFPMAPLGSVNTTPLRLDPGSHRIAITLLAVQQASGRRVLLQHRFDGESQWSAPTESRTLELPQIGPGDYRLLVRAFSPDSALSVGQVAALLPDQLSVAQPAVIEFTVATPLWRRPWFATLMLLGTALGGYLLYRQRLARAVALERLRTRIATDLHDDVGADLSRISLLAEFAQRDLSRDPGRAGTLIAESARTARSALGEMSDIVWALKPERDTLGHLVTRLRDHAAELAGPLGVEFEVVADAEVARRHLTGELRRDLYLLLKEAIANALKHSKARAIHVEVTTRGDAIRGEVRDDGIGFDLAHSPSGSGGNGLGHMRTRAERLRGTLTIQSAPGAGTRVVIEVPGT